MSTKNDLESLRQSEAQRRAEQTDKLLEASRRNRVSLSKLPPAKEHKTSLEESPKPER